MTDQEKLEASISALITTAIETVSQAVVRDLGKLRAQMEEEIRAQLTERIRGEVRAEMVDTMRFAFSDLRQVKLQPPGPALGNGKAAEPAPKPEKKKRHYSAEGLANIRAGARKRWANHNAKKAGAA